MSIPAEDALSAAAPTPAIRANGDIAVELDGVTKRFGKVAALDDVSLLVRRGELMTLLGPSGCGKTTLLNLVGGFLMPDSGEIAIDSQRVTNVPAYRREIGITFQNYALFPHMNVAANVGYGLRMRRVAKAEIARRVADALALIKLAGLEDRKPRQLSGGQQQRVALARALVIRPKVLLLDEPFSALDRNLRASMQVELKEIQRKLGVTTIFVTHDQSEALSLSDRIAVMAEGRIRQLGSPDEIYRRPVDRFVASFVGDVNVLRARLERIDGAIATVAGHRIRPLSCMPGRHALRRAASRRPRLSSLPSGPPRQPNGHQTRFPLATRTQIPTPGQGSPHRSDAPDYRGPQGDNPGLRPGRSERHADEDVRPCQLRRFLP